MVEPNIKCLIVENKETESVIANILHSLKELLLESRSEPTLYSEYEELESYCDPKNIICLKWPDLLEIVQENIIVPIYFYLLIIEITSKTDCISSKKLFMHIIRTLNISINKKIIIAKSEDEVLKEYLPMFPLNSIQRINKNINELIPKISTNIENDIMQAIRIDSFKDVTELISSSIVQVSENKRPKVLSNVNFSKILCFAASKGNKEIVLALLKHSK